MVDHKPQPFGRLLSSVGIMILTSNRIGIIDEAVKSRVQLALIYRPLTHEQRKRIWANFLARLRTLGESMDLQVEDHIDRLASYALSGREIRNAVNTARQLASVGEIPLGLAHLDRAIKVSGQFNDYLAHVQGDTSSKLAFEKGVRDDEWR